MSETPERIYLQHWPHDEATWCVDRIDDDEDHPDVEYVRADLCAALEQDRARLRGWLEHIAYAHCVSALLGEGPCDPGGECPGCAARAALAESAAIDAAKQP
jgi:hypothetical protein